MSAAVAFLHLIMIAVFANLSPSATAESTIIVTTNTTAIQSSISPSTITKSTTKTSTMNLTTNTITIPSSPSTKTAKTTKTSLISTPQANTSQKPSSSAQTNAPSQQSSTTSTTPATSLKTSQTPITTTNHTTWTTSIEQTSPSSAASVTVTNTTLTENETTLITTETTDTFNTTDYRIEPISDSSQSTAMKPTEPTTSNSTLNYTTAQTTRKPTRKPTTDSLSSSMTKANPNNSPPTSTGSKKMITTSDPVVTKHTVNTRVTREIGLTTPNEPSLPTTLTTTKLTTKPVLTTVTKYQSYPAVNGTCRRGFVAKENKTTCVYLCEDKVCQNDGVCTVVNDIVGNKPIAMCRCKPDDDVEYSGDSCENAKPSRLKERKITLGILIPLFCILFVVLSCTCLKLKRNGKAARNQQHKYDLNSGAL